jgi:type IV secretory pathway VirB6-like protein
VFHRFSFEAGDGPFKLLVDLLIAGWVLMLVFIGVLIVAPILLAILMKTPTVLARFQQVSKDV